MAIVALTTGLALQSGCDSTFEQSARGKLAAQRELDRRTSQLVTKRTPDIRATRVTLVRDATSTAVVVEVTNQAAVGFTDVPITVGVERGTHKIILNEAPNLDWFQTHLPSIAAGTSTTWVFRSPPGRGAKAGDVPFARVGASVAPEIPAGTALPELVVRDDATATAPEPTTPDQAPDPKRPVARGWTRGVVQNNAGPTQLRLPVYAVVRNGGVITGAGYTTVPELPGGERRSFDLPLTGRLRGIVQLSTTPTISN